MRPQMTQMNTDGHQARVDRCGWKRSEGGSAEGAHVDSTTDEHVPRPREDTNEVRLIGTCHGYLPTKNEGRMELMPNAISIDKL